MENIVFPEYSSHSEMVSRSRQCVYGTSINSIHSIKQPGNMYLSSIETVQHLYMDKVINPLKMPRYLFKEKTNIVYFH